MEEKNFDDECIYHLFELGYSKNINKCKMATEIRFQFDSECVHTQIDFTEFVRLKKINVLNISFIEQLLLPENLKEIKFNGTNFNSKLSNLPSNLLILNLENIQNYNCVLDNLPLGLKELYLNTNYFQPLDYLPESLEKLHFKCFNYPYTFDNLPNNINELHINKYFIDKTNKFPTNLKKIIVSDRAGFLFYFEKLEVIEKLIEIKNYDHKIKIEFIKG